MPLVVDQVCRFSVHATMNGRAVVNILDMSIDTTGSALSRAEAIEQQAEIILQEWDDTIAGWQVNDMVYDRVDWVDLDSTSGPVGSTQSGSGAATWPATGNSTSDPLPPNVTVLVRKQTTPARGQRQGRMFLSGFSEGIPAATNSSTVDPTALTSINTDLASFLGDIEQADPDPFDFQSELVVVHTTNGLTGTSSPVNELIAQSRLATQRRRLRG